MNDIDSRDIANEDLLDLLKSWENRNMQVGPCLLIGLVTFIAATMAAAPDEKACTVLLEVAYKLAVERNKQGEAQ